MQVPGYCKRTHELIIFMKFDLMLSSCKLLNIIWASYKASLTMLLIIQYRMRFSSRNLNNWITTDDKRSLEFHTRMGQKVL